MTIGWPEMPERKEIVYPQSSLGSFSLTMDVPVESLVFKRSRLFDRYRERIVVSFEPIRRSSTFKNRYSDSIPGERFTR
jgi:hypothetical protein